MSLNASDIIPLCLQLSDGESDRFVRAVVRNHLGTTLNTVALTHLSGGLYQDQSVQMPDVPFVSVRYEVFLDENFTQPDPLYAGAFEIFDQDEAKEVLAAISSLNDNVDSADGRAV